jgi:hypothetical protein
MLHQVSVQAAASQFQCTEAGIEAFILHQEVCKVNNTQLVPI